MSVITRRKVLFDAQRFLIDGQVAWNSASAPARLPNIFNGLHNIVSHNE